MAKKKREEEAHGQSAEAGSGRWMLTYLDMVTLLFGVFIILFAMSKVDQKKYDQVADSLQQAFTGGKTIAIGMQTGGRTIIESLRPQGVRSAEKLRQLAADILHHLKAKKVRVDETEEGLRIGLASDSYFAPGSAELKQNANLANLRLVNELIERLPEQYSVRITGHTDNSPLELNDVAGKGPRFGNNWELSTARATTIMYTLIKNGAEERRFTVAGRGEHDPIESNDTPEGRAYNRRVDIYITPIR